MNIYSTYFRIIKIISNLSQRLLNKYSNEIDVADFEEIETRIKSLNSRLNLDNSSVSYTNLYKNLKSSNNTVSAIVRYFRKNNIDNPHLERIEKLNKCLIKLGDIRYKPNEANEQFVDFINNKKISFQKLSVNNKDQNIKEFEKEYILLRKLISDQNENINELARKSYDVEENVKKLIIDTKYKSDEILNNLKSSLEEVEKEIQLFRNNLSEASAKSLAVDYAKAASDEKSEANTMRYFAISAIILISLISGYTLKETLKDSELSITFLVVRLSFIFCLSIAAAYFSRESSKHRKQQYFFHERSLSFSTINLYLSDIGQELKDKAKIDLSSNFFQRNEDKSNSNSYPIDLQETINKLIDKIPTTLNK